ncbi:Component of a membrane-bound complex containing the Tor2p kinase [Coemansia interrupta]|uniref:Component of a membrane-bound complex containing the Tor2p kinase n=1 Tax=Coemansia interrupta TaxID=1126814 RepID=A0A9W8HM74_9FUNG|nr:Component of a membrane-bound complex containing the Tor2p kinase [Coemansia interrupta]
MCAARKSSVTVPAGVAAAVGSGSEKNELMAGNGFEAMALLNDPAFLIYQLRVSLVRSNDVLGARMMTFDDLAPAPHARPLAGMTPGGSGGEHQRRRQSSASEVRRQVAHNAQANAYIAASGYCPEVDAAHSPEPSDDAELRLAGMGTGGLGGGGGGRRQRRAAKEAAGAVAEDEPVGLGVVRGGAGPQPPPPVRRSLDTVRARPLAMVGEAADPGSLSDGQTTPGAAADRHRLRAALSSGSAAAAASAASAAAGTTIRLQRPGGRKGSSRDAMALAVDFDVTKFAPPAEAPRKTSSDSAHSSASGGRRSGERKESAAARRIPLAGLKRSATLPTKRPAARSRWAGAQAVQPRAQAAGWVGGPASTWDQSSGSDEEEEGRGERRPRRGQATHTWYGPRTSLRPVSMFPGAANVPVPPVPLLFGADDSDDDIDLEGDEGSARTPAALGLHAAMAGPASPSVRSRSSSLASTGVRSRAGSLGADARAQPRRASRLALRAQMPASSVPAQPSPLAAGVLDAAALQTSLAGVQASAQPVDAPFVPPPPPKASGLAALLAGAGDVRPNPLADEFSGVGAAAGASFALRVFVRPEQPPGRAELALRVRPGATVEQAIGYALHQWAELHPEAAGDALDVVGWVLRIADDGEVDDDFPVLDRARPVAQFGFDEFVVCPATPEQVLANEAARVRQGKPPRMPRPQSLAAPAPAALAAARDTSAGGAEIRRGVVPRKEYSAVVLQPSRMAVASTAGIFVGTSLLAAHAGSLPPLDPSTASAAQSAGSLGRQPRFLRIRVLPASDQPAAEALHATTVEIDRPGATVAWVLTQVRRRKPFSDDDFVLGVVERSRFVACNPDMPVAHVPSGVELCLHRVGAPMPRPDVLAAYERRWSDAAPAARQPPDPAAATAASDHLPPSPSLSSAAPAPAPATSESTYYTFNVVRRAQMFARHDRLLVIDGEVVTLMPADHRTESAKTLTLHIANIVCKRNQRSPKKIRLMLVRRSNSGDKSVDLEAASEDDADAICSILVRMREIHAANNPADFDAELI